MDVTELRVRRAAFAEAELAAHPLPALAAGEVLVKVGRFGLTANNVSYALSGDMIGYWKFFPTPDPFGIVPVWGFGEVIAAEGAEVAVGAQLWGFLPMASHVVMRPAQVRRGGFIDAAAHRQPLPEVYNRYVFTADDPPELAALADARCALFPLFFTSYILYDYITDNDAFGATQVVIGSASSKTGFGLAELLNTHARGRLSVIGLTSPGNRAFVEGLGVCDRVLAYDEVATLDPSQPTVFVDMSGSGPVTAAIHGHFGAQVRASISVGATHWDAPRHRGAVEGAPPTFFFAPGQILKREADWGPGEIMRRAQAECVRITGRLGGRLRFTHAEGPEAALAAYRRMVAGQTAPDEAVLVSLNA